MNKRHESALADLKARQLAGEHMPCPRCGSFSMKPALHTNALSRHADIYVCDGCSTEEAMLVFMNNPLCTKMPVITSSNKLRTYTTARYYTDEEILQQITKGGK